MSSGDFTFITLRNITAYQTNNAYIPNDYLLTMSTNGNAQWTNHIKLNTLTASSITTSTINIDILSFSSITGSTINIDTLSFSSITGSTITANTMELHSSLTVSSIKTGLLSTDIATFSSLTGSTITANTMTLNSLTTVTPSFALGLDASNQVITFPASAGTVTTSSLTSRFIPYLSTGTTLTNSLFNQINNTDIGMGFTSVPNYPFNPEMLNLYVNGTIYGGAMYASAGIFGRNDTTIGPVGYITFAQTEPGTFMSQITSHTSASNTPDAIWVYSNTDADPLTANTGQVELTADKLTLNLANGLHVDNISTMKINAFNGTISTIGNLAVSGNENISGTLTVPSLSTNVISTTTVAANNIVANTIDSAGAMYAVDIYASQYTLSSIIMEPATYSTVTNYTNTVPANTSSMLINIGGTMWKIPIERA